MSIGRIDWFGGLSEKTGKVNRFGFIIPINENSDEKIYVNEKDVPQQIQSLLERDIYVRFEIISDASEKRAVGIKLVSAVGVISHFNRRKGIVNYENCSDIPIRLLENLQIGDIQIGDIVSFYLKYNSKLKRDEAILYEKINTSTEDKFIIKKCAKSNNSEIFKSFIFKYTATLENDEAIKFVSEKLNLPSIQEQQDVARSLVGTLEKILVASPILHKLLISSLNKISHYCRFINKYIDPLDKFSNQEILNELLNKFNSSSFREQQNTIKTLINEAGNLLLASPELRKALISNKGSKFYKNDEISTYCQFINKYINTVDEVLNQELLEEFLEEVSQSSDTLKLKYWNQINFLKEELKYKGKYWDIAPQNIKADVIKQNYKKFFNVLFQFEQCEYPFDKSLSFSWKKLYDLNDIDKQLVKQWCSAAPENSFKQGQMISARGAEKLAIKFYNALGYSVEDTSAHQVTKCSSTWCRGDIRLDKNLLIDVKNARTAVNSNSYSEFCVPSFKQERGNDVLITAVLSPYLQREFMDGGKDANFSVIDPIVLGEFNKVTLSHLESIFNDSSFSINLPKNTDLKTYLPPWLFDYNNLFYSKKIEIINNFISLNDSDIPDWEDILLITKNNPIPLFIAAKKHLPKKWNSYFPNWKIDFIEMLVTLPLTNISLPSLFLSILKHFLTMLSYEGSDYSPQQYQKILYVNSTENRPLKVYDPLHIIKDFCDTLQSLWSFRQSANLMSFKIFRFNGKGLLQGQQSETDKLSTILAYCGGWVEGKGKCGCRPLVIGKHKNCIVCKHLICPNENCQHCTDNCEEYQGRKQREIYRSTQSF